MRRLPGDPEFSPVRIFSTEYFLVLRPQLAWLCPGTVERDEIWISRSFQVLKAVCVLEGGNSVPPITFLLFGHVASVDVV